MNRRCFIQMGCYILVCLFLTISTASARVCFLPDSTDCGSSDVNIPDVPCKYYSCKEAGGESNAYQTCYPERTYNNGGVNVTCWQVKCNISKSECEAQAKATSQSCKFDDASGCYYLGECKQCNKDLYDLKEPKSGSDWECDSCTGCDGTFYNCTAKEKECYQINSNYTSKCADSQTAEEVKGVKDSKGNQCYTCKDKPIDKCVDIAAIKDEQEPIIKTTQATATKEETTATLKCGDKLSFETPYYNHTKIQGNGTIVAASFETLKYYYDNEDKQYYLRYTNPNVNNGEPLCLANQLCAQYITYKRGDFKTPYYVVSVNASSNDYNDYSQYQGLTWCCDSQRYLSGESASSFRNCKSAGENSTIQTDERYRVKKYTCPEGYTLNGTKCVKTTYTCPTGYTLGTDNTCKQTTCKQGYTLQDVNGQKRCVADAYSCPTDGKYKYKLSGNKCVCDNDKPSDDDSITVRFQYTCNGQSCSSDVTDKIKYDFNGEVGNNTSGTAIAKTDWNNTNVFEWMEAEEFTDRNNPYSCTFDGIGCGKYDIDNGYDNDACNAKEVETYYLYYHDLDFDYDNTDVISKGSFADVEMYPLKDENTGKYFYLMRNEYDVLSVKCTALAMNGGNFDDDAYDRCMLQGAHEVTNNEIVLQLPLKGGEQCTALDGQKCIYYVVSCPYDTADCMNNAHWKPYYTITSSGDSSRVTSDRHYMQLMSDDGLQAKFEKTKNYNLEPKSNKIVYYSCDLQKWDKVTLEAYTDVIGYAFNLNDQCSTVRKETHIIEGGPDADQVVTDKLIGYVRIGGYSTISGTTVTSNLYIAGTVHDEFTIGGINQPGFSVYYNCGHQTGDNHQADMYSTGSVTVRAGKYNWGGSTVFTQTSSATDCSANYGEASVGRTYFNVYGGNRLSTRCKDTTGSNGGGYIKDSKGAYIILCGAKYDNECNTAY